MFLLWPPFQNSTGYDAVKAFSGNIILFSGEDGVTGNDQLFKEFETNWTLVSEFKQFDPAGSETMHSAFYLYQRKKVV